MHPEAERLIEELGLEPHPEGGYFIETYRSAVCVDAESGTRDALTSIYYLLTGDAFSAFHRLTSDEIWHHYRGAPITLETLDVDGDYRSFVIGDGERWQAAIPAGVWFAAHVADPASYALIGCDVARGFEFDDFELASRAELLQEFPQHASLIERWTSVD